MKVSFGRLLFLRANFFLPIAPFLFCLLLTHLMTKAGFICFSREAGCCQNHMMVDRAKASQLFTKGMKTTHLGGGRGAPKVTWRSNPAETCMCLAVMKSILLRANRSTPLARSDHNFSVNVYGYTHFFFAGTRGTREQTHCRIKPCNINRLHINSSHFTSSPDTGCSSSLRLRCQGFSKCVFPGFLQQEPASFLKAKRSRPKLHVVSL